MARLRLAAGLPVSVGAATRALAKTLRALTKVPSHISPAFAAWATKRIRADIRQGKTSYGQAYAPLKASTVRRKGHSKPLIRSRKLVGTAGAKPLPGGGVGLDAGPASRRFLITGTKHMVARPYLPVNTLPATWRAELARLSHEAFGVIGK